MRNWGDISGRPARPSRHSEAPEGPWESVPPVGEIRIATSGLRPSSQGRIMVQHLRRGGLWPPALPADAMDVGRGIPDAPPIMRAPRSRPRPASLGPLGQFTSSRATKNAPCRAGACPRRRLCVLLSMFSVGAAFGRPAGQATMIICVGRDDSARRPRGRLPDPPGLFAPFGTRRGGACPSRRFCTAPFDLGEFRRPGGE